MDGKLGRGEIGRAIGERTVEEVKTTSSDDRPIQPVQPSEPVRKPDQSLT